MGDYSTLARIQQAGLLIDEAEADADYERMQRDIALAPECGKTSDNLSRRCIPHLPCDLELGHDGFCSFEAL